MVYLFSSENMNNEIATSFSDIALVSHHKNDSVITNGSQSPAIVTQRGSMSTTFGSCSPAVSIKNHSQSVTSSDCCPAICFGNFSKATTKGSQSHAIALGKHNIIRTNGENSIAIGLACGSIGSVHDGALILSYKDENNNVRVRVGYTNEDIDPDKLYRLDKNNNFQIVEFDEELIEVEIQQEIFNNE